MAFRGIILTGTSGAGKSTLSDELRKVDAAFAQVKAVTTRAPRPDDAPGTYDYLTAEEFEAREPSLLIWAEYRGKRYGITRDHVAEVEAAGKVPMLLITPRSLAEFLQRSGANGQPFLTVFVDAPDDVLDARRGLRGDAERQVAAAAQRAEDLAHRGSCLYQLENIRLDESLGRLLGWWREGPAHQPPVNGGARP